MSRKILYSWKIILQRNSRYGKSYCRCLVNGPKAIGNEHDHDKKNDQGNMSNHSTQEVHANELTGSQSEQRFHVFPEKYKYEGQDQISESDNSSIFSSESNANMMKKGFSRIKRSDNQELNKEINESISDLNRFTAEEQSENCAGETRTSSPTEKELRSMSHIEDIASKISIKNLRPDFSNRVNELCVSLNTDNILDDKTKQIEEEACESILTGERSGSLSETTEVGSRSSLDEPSSTGERSGSLSETTEVGSRSSLDEPSSTGERSRSLSETAEVGSRSLLNEPSSDLTLIERNTDSVYLDNSLENLDWDGDKDIEVDEVLSSDELEEFDSEVSAGKTVAPLKPSYTLAPYVDKSEVLTNLVKLGVNLSWVEERKGMADMLMKLDFKRDVQPYLFFLKDIGVPDDELGYLISRNPHIFEESIENLQIKVNYFKSKKFVGDDIARIVTKAPMTLVMRVEEIDKKLGYYQNTFHLTGSEVRDIVRKVPTLITWPLESVKDKKFYIEEFLGFTDVEMKKMLLEFPKLYFKNKYHLAKRFEYLHHVMGISHERMVQWPRIFNTRLFIIKQRHQYLVSLGRAQYDPTKEKYIALSTLVIGNNEYWCTNTAKTSIEQYNNFLKTL